MLQQGKEICLLLSTSNKNNRERTCPVSLTLDCHILAGGTAGKDAKGQCPPQSSALQTVSHPNPWFCYVWVHF